MMMIMIMMMMTMIKAIIIVIMIMVEICHIPIIMTYSHLVGLRLVGMCWQSMMITMPGCHWWQSNISFTNLRLQCNGTLWSNFQSVAIQYFLPI